MDVFASYKQEVKAPYMRDIAREAKKILKAEMKRKNPSIKKKELNALKLQVKVPRDLRYLQKLLETKMEHNDNVVKFDSSFELFKKYMEGPIKDRPELPPTAIEMGGSFSKWLLTNSTVWNSGRDCLGSSSAISHEREHPLLRLR